MEISLKFVYGVDVPDTARSLSVAVKINDDEYNPWDYFGIVFDMNENGVIDSGLGDTPIVPWANNMTSAPLLLETGFFVFPEHSPQHYQNLLS